MTGLYVKGVQAMSRQHIISMALAILGIACLVIVSVLVPGRVAEENQGELAGSSKEPPELNADPRVTAESARFVGRSEGKKRWEFAADKVSIPDESDWVELEGISDGVFYDEGEAWMYFSAERARVNKNTDKLDLEKVRFSPASGDTGLTADTLTWDKDYDKVIFEGNVRITQGLRAILTCARAEYAPGDNILEAIGETVFELEIEDD